MPQYRSYKFSRTARAGQESSFPNIDPNFERIDGVAIASGRNCYREPREQRNGSPAVSSLPVSLAPRGLSRAQAAEYIGVGVTKFDELVDDGRMPRPKRIDGRIVWDRIKLDEAFDALDDEGGPSNEWDAL